MIHLAGAYSLPSQDGNFAKVDVVVDFSDAGSRLGARSATVAA
jgi:hypothetical protein